jgi:serine/threonine protein kinase
MVTELCRGSALQIVQLTYLSLLDKLSMAREACLGMVYLSEQGIVHADLALRNLLVAFGETETSKFPIKVADFGLRFSSQF